MKLKRMISMILTVVLLCGVFSTAFATEAVMAGDVSGDGEITAEDARLCLRQAVGLEKYEKGSREYRACDVTNDGEVTAEDARLILRAAVGLEKLHTYVYTEWAAEKDASGAPTGKHSRVGEQGEKETADCTYGDWVIVSGNKEPTCTEPVVKEKTCSECGGKITETIAALGHNYGAWTKLNDTQHQRVCSRDASHVEKEDHKWDSGKVTTAATCTATGVKTYTCSVCKVTKTETIAKDASNHTGGTEVKNAKAATCAETGYTGDTCCKGCGAKLKAGTTIAKTTSHTWDAGKVTTAATCAATGVKTYTCSVCKTTKTETIAKDASNHTGGTEVKNAKAATCAAAGYTGDTYCKGCGAKLKTGTTIAKTTTHTWDAGKVTKAATCTAAGVKTYTCTVCKTTKTETIAKLGHNYGAWTKLNDTQHQRVCSNDGTHVEKANHSWDAGTVTTAATCTATGVKTYTCSVCKGTKTETIAKNAGNHTGGTEVRNAKAATCAATGYTGDTYCKGCGAKLQTGTTIAKTTTHTWDAGTVTTAATCAAEGVKTYTCSVCKTTKTETIAKNAGNHTGGTEVRNAKAATCVAAGYTGDTYCTGCGAKLQAGTTIAKTTNHTWDEGKVKKAATCTADGTKTYTCTICRTTKTETIAKLGHNYGAWTKLNNTQHQRVCANNSSHVEKENHTWDGGRVTTPATCTATGVKTYTCTVCQGTKTETIAKLGHNYGAWTKQDNTQHQRICANDSSHVERANHTWDSGKVTTAATCTAPGVKTYTCSVCKGTKTESIAQLGHNYGSWTKLNDTQHQRVCSRDGSHVEKANHTWDSGKVTTAATCTATGVKTYTCSVCRGTKTETIAKLGHNYGAWTKLNDTQHQRVCANNGSHVEKADHSWDGGRVTTPATCTATGVRTYTCSVCKGTKTETIAKLGHNYGAWTKLNDSQHQRVCANDNSHIEKANHSWDSGRVTTAATCTATGVKTYTCSVCNGTKTETVAQLGHNYGSWTRLNDTQHQRVCSRDASHVEKANHSWDNGKVTTAATCTAPGVKTYTCSVCKATKTETIAQLGHNYGSWTKLNDTQHQRVCANDRSHVEKANHTWDAGKVTRNVSCTVDGSKTYTCTVCKATKTETIPALGHDFSVLESHVSVPTCTSTGSDKLICSRCSIRNIVTVPKDPNNHPENRISSSITGVVTPTCTSYGEYYVSTVCKDCNAIITQDEYHRVDPLPHSTYEVAAVAPTCTTDGNIKYYVCNNCDGLFRDAAATQQITQNDTVDPQLGHLASEEFTKVYSVQTTCTVDGQYQRVRYCSRGCGFVMETDPNVYPETKFEHMENGVLASVNVEAAEATCTEPAHTAGTRCRLCGATLSGIETSGTALGHDFILPAENALGITAADAAHSAGLCCSRCGVQQADPLGTYNTLINTLKLSGQDHYAYSHNVATFGQTQTNSDYHRFKTTGIVLILPDVENQFASEMRKSETTYSQLYASGWVLSFLPIKNDLSHVSKLETGDATVTVTTKNGFNSNEILDSSIPDSFKATNGGTYNIAKYRNISVDGKVIVVTVKLKQETYTPSGGISGVGANDLTAMQKFNGKDIRDIAAQYGENGVMTEEESDTGYSMSSRMELKSIVSNGTATYYFRASDYQPIAAVYDTSIVTSQDVSMNITFGMSGSITVDPYVTERTRDFYLFPGIFPVE